MLLRILSGVIPPTNPLFTSKEDPFVDMQKFLSVLSGLGVIKSDGVVDLDNYVVQGQYAVAKEQGLQAGLSPQKTEAYNLLLFSLFTQHGPGVTVVDIALLIKDFQQLIAKYSWFARPNESGYDFCLRVSADLFRSRTDIFNAHNETCVAVIQAIKNDRPVLGDCKAMSAFYAALALLNGYAVQSNLNEVKFSPQDPDFEGHMRFRVQDKQGEWVLCESLKSRLSADQYGSNSPKKKMVSLIDQAPVDLMMSEVLHEYWRKHKRINAENISATDFNWQRIHHFFSGLESGPWKIHNIKKEMDSLIAGLKDLFTKTDSLRRAYLDKFLIEDETIDPVYASLIIPMGMLFAREYLLFYNEDKSLNREMLCLVRDSTVLREAVIRLLKVSLAAASWLNNFNIDYQDFIQDLQRIQQELG